MMVAGVFLSRFRITLGNGFARADADPAPAAFGDLRKQPDRYVEFSAEIENDVSFAVYLRKVRFAQPDLQFDRLFQNGYVLYVAGGSEDPRGKYAPPHAIVRHRSVCHRFLSELLRISPSESLKILRPFPEFSEWSRFGYPHNQTQYNIGFGVCQ